MKILALESGFPPELASGRLPYELSREFVRRGHTVAVVTVFPRRHLITKKVRNHRSKFFYWEEMEGVRVMRVQPEFSHKSLGARAVEYLTLPVSLFLGALLAGRSDVILCSSIPFIGFSGCLLGKIMRVPVIVRLQDIHPDALVKLGMLKNSLLIRFLELIERYVYQCATHITVISEGCRNHVASKGIDHEKIDLIPNWASIDRIRPSSKANDFRREHDLSGKFIITYAGIMSWPQDLETVVESANLLREYKDIQFLLVGEGEQKKLLKEKIKKLKLDNIKLLPLQPRETYFKILQASDVCLVSLKKSYTSPTVPSKMLDIMACSKPVMANVPCESDVHRIVERAKCGIWVEPENREALSQAVLKLYESEDLAKQLGGKGREFVENHLSLTACLDRYEELLNRFVAKNIRS